MCPFTVANSEAPAPNLKTSLTSRRRSSVGKQQYNARHSRRFSRQESLVGKSQQQGILETDENALEDSPRNAQTSNIETREESKVQEYQEKQAPIGSTDCSVM